MPENNYDDIEDEELKSVLQDEKLWGKLEKEMEKENWKLWAAIWATSAYGAYNKAQKYTYGDMTRGKMKPEIIKSVDKIKKLENDRALKYFENHGTELIKSLSKTDVERMKNTLRDNWGKGINTFMADAKNSYPVSKSRLETIFRTEYHTAYEHGRYSTARDMALDGWEIIKIMRHSGNPNPRIEHLQADGQERKMGEVFSFGQEYPAAPRCGCWVDYNNTGKRIKVSPKDIPEYNKPTVKSKGLNIKPSKKPVVNPVKEHFKETKYVSPKQQKLYVDAKTEKILTTTDYKIETVPKLPEKTADINDWNKSLSPLEKTTINKYSKNDFKYMNKYMRNPDDIIDILDPEDITDLKNKINVIESALNKASLPEPTTVYRGIGNPTIINDPSAIVGKVIRDEAFASTTLDRSIASSFAERSAYELSSRNIVKNSKGVVLEIELPAGSKAGFVGKISDVPTEAEILLQRNSRIEITEVLDDGGGFFPWKLKGKLID